VELEERTLEGLPDRCANCGTELTDKEKATVLEEKATVALCTTCAAEAEPLPDPDSEDFEA
jgi:uncharacterized protein with PIN domain